MKFKEIEYTQKIQLGSICLIIHSEKEKMYKIYCIPQSSKSKIQGLKIFNYLKKKYSKNAKACKACLEATLKLLQGIKV